MAKHQKVTKAEVSAAAKVMETRKEQLDDPKKIAKEEKVRPFLSCGDCDTKLPVGTKVCPKCGYAL